MFDKFNMDDDRGITGIGTLIIFIALVIAAALAAGVVLDTTGLLQSKATQTGQDSTKQVSNQLQLLAVTGAVDGSSNNVTDLYVKTFKSPGADDIDLSEVTVQYVSPNDDETLEYNGTSAADGFDVTSLKDDDSSLSNQIMNSQSDRAALHLNLTALSNIDELEPGDEVTLRLTTQSGSQTVRIVSVPDTLYGGSQSVVEL